MVVNDFDVKQSARYSRVLVVNELVLSGTQCMSTKSTVCHTEKATSEIHPYTERWAREVIPSRTVYTKSCALYLGTDLNTLGDKTMLDY